MIPNRAQKHVLQFVRLVADRVGILLRDQKDAEASQKEQHKAYHAQNDDNLGLLGEPAIMSARKEAPMEATVPVRLVIRLQMEM